MTETDQARRWVDYLSEEDLAYIKRFVLASGSLKALAEEYDVSYPTVRRRMDRLIERVRIYDSQGYEDEFERVARGLCADGKISPDALAQLLRVHRKEQEE
jgi:hypothetical protein